VRDGGSTDNSPQIIEHYTSQLTDWVSQKDRGQADAINQGGQAGRGGGAKRDFNDCQIK
jgi:glycosyltransferase involved in cell wall biosynthesis